MHGQEAVDVMFCLVPKYHGFSISTQSCEFGPHLEELNNLHFKLCFRDIGFGKVDVEDKIL